MRAGYGTVYHCLIRRLEPGRALELVVRPAMLTIIFALLMILGSYVVQFIVAAALLNPWWAALYIATLPVGAYWAAFRDHPEPA